MVSIQELNIGGSKKMMRKKPSSHKYENQRCSYGGQAMLASLTCWKNHYVASDSGSPSQPPQAHPGAAFPRLLLQPRMSVSCRGNLTWGMVTAKNGACFCFYICRPSVGGPKAISLVLGFGVITSIIMPKIQESRDLDTFIADVISSASSKFVAAFAQRREEKISVGKNPASTHANERDSSIHQQMGNRSHMPHQRQPQRLTFDTPSQPTYYAEKVHQEKVQQERLKAVKVRLNFEETSQHSESGTPSRKKDLKKRIGPRHARRMSGSPDQGTTIQSLQGKRSGKKNGVQKTGEGCVPQAWKQKKKETEFAFEKRHNKRASSRRTEALSDSEGSARGHSKSKPKRQKSSVEDDMSQPWSTLMGNARVWFDDLPKEPIDSYDDLKEAFLENYLQQKKCIKDPVEIYNIKHRDGESTEEFVLRYKLECRDVKGAPECMKIVRFMHGITNPELIKQLHDKIPKSVDEIMRVTTTFLRGEVAASNRERKKSFQSWKQQEAGQKPNFKKGGFREPTKAEAKARHIHPSHKNTKRNYCIGQWKVQASFVNNNPAESGEKGGNPRKGKTAGNTDGTTMTEGSQTKDYSNFLSGIEILYEHCFNRFHPKVRSQMIPAATPLVGFNEEIIWPLGQISLLVKIGDEEHSTSAWMNFMIVRSPSPYNGTVRRPGPADMNGVPRHIAEHRLNIREGCLPIRQKKSGQATQRNKAIYEEAEKLVDAGIIKEVHYHNWLSNPVIVKKHDGRWRMSLNSSEIVMVQKQIWFGIQKVKAIPVVVASEMEVKPQKCTFGMREGMFLGYKGNADGLKVCPDKVKAVLSLPSPKCLKDVQRLNGKLASLNRFLSKSAEKSLPFVKTLKKCTEKSDLHWTTKAEMAFKQMKTLIAELPMLIVPKEKEELVIYLASTKEAVSAVLMTERGGKQISIYFVSCTLQGPKINYAPMEKLILALRFELEEHDIHYRPRTSVKGQILADFIVERLDDDPPDTPMEDKEVLSDPWILFTDGSSCIDGSGPGLIITNPKRMEFTYDLRRNSTRKKEKSKGCTPQSKEANYVLREIHEGSCNMHGGPRSVVATTLRSGYYWPTMHTDAKKLIRECNDCQVHRPVPRNPQQNLTPITSLWPFYIWGIDIARPFPEGPGKVKFLIVAIDYFTKWIKVKPVATIMRAQIKKFVWDNIVCKFSLPGEIISDNEKQFRDNPFKDWCESYVSANALLSLSTYKPTAWWKGQTGV
uniref:Reverse transcriptase domain-containing protein n=1 Tax=Tanacetum cinerariifolium TaxID=118510 RepID=A0A6L2MJI2_TANCI|nr:reverse transcriptase domain-containing protein [Tanacetum cinerariifolium]